MAKPRLSDLIKAPKAQRPKRRRALGDERGDQVRRQPCADLAAEKVSDDANSAFFQLRANDRAHTPIRLQPEPGSNPVEVMESVAMREIGGEGVAKVALQVVLPRKADRTVHLMSQAADLAIGLAHPRLCDSRLVGGVRFAALNQPDRFI